MTRINVPVQFTGEIPVEVPDELRGFEIGEDMKRTIAEKIAVATVLAETDAEIPYGALDELDEIVGANLQDEDLKKLSDGVVGASGKWETIGYSEVEGDG